MQRSLSGGPLLPDAVISFLVQSAEEVTGLLFALEDTLQCPRSYSEQPGLRRQHHGHAPLELATSLLGKGLNWEPESDGQQVSVESMTSFGGNALRQHGLRI